MIDPEIVWDKTNIGENYPGVTSPLTYSFIKNAYSKVYKNFIKFVGVDKETIENNKSVFDNMLGFVHGEVFYNINNWYELIKLLPGYRYNKIFFENMLNPAVNKRARLKSKITPKFLWSNRNVIFKFFRSIIFINPLYKKFDEEFNSNYKRFNPASLKRLDNFSLVSKFEDLQNGFISCWTYTIVNDFRVMIYYGLLTKYIKKHFPKDSNKILSSIYGIKNKPDSIKPLKNLIKIAQLIKSSQKYTRLFKERPAKIFQKLNRSEYKTIKKEISNYLDLFGERAFNELKLEEINFNEQPETLISLLSHYVHYSGNELEMIRLRFDSQRKHNVDLYTNTLKLPGRIFLNYLTKNTINSIYKREEYRLKRATVFNIAKKFYKEIAKRMVKAGDIKEKNNIFFLYTDEVFDYIRYHRLKENLEELIEKRKHLLKSYEEQPLSRRVSTRGLPSQEIIVSKMNKQRRELTGKITSQGVIDKIKVVVMPKLDLTVDVKDRVLVTKATDPGWTVLFPLIKGILIENGGLLSHASIIARELSIPCMVMPAVTNLLSTGDTIKLDAVKGYISIL